ncbi:extracellular solute-binding protein [Desulfosarcina ovata]|uniref:Iron transporter n=1 Tax=Desulfosarcina ovata subsp. ovata TaxID=2752305 RepID=A0A5K8A4R0_9BACT|nr:extracellular solute-binding protein [Desulfosarcina ovata]BBO87535.1 iron transporter [Desulfosarcina ovata subsp. ovata]
MAKIALRWLVVSLILMCSAAVGAAAEVVVYTSVDQIFSQSILQDYEKQTGVEVKAVYDVEAAKTTGLVNRLIAEKNRPQCDVFWNSEIGKTIVLREKGVLAPYASPAAKEIPAFLVDKDKCWTGFAARARVLVYNTDMIKEGDLPESIFGLTEPQWRGKVAMAYPLFGTTATHTAAMFTTFGEEKAKNYLQALKANEVVIVDGNSVVRDLVVEGRLPIGFTDTDDVNVAIQAGKPVKMLYPDKKGVGTLLIPNTVALIKNAPHPEEGKKFIDYLLSKEIESKLSFSESANMPVRDGVKTPDHVPAYSSIKAMEVDYYQVAETMPEAARFCQTVFVR